MKFSIITLQTPSTSNISSRFNIREDNCQSSSSHDDDSVHGSVDPVHDCSLPSDTITPPHLSTTSQSVSGGMHILDESTHVKSSHAFRSAKSLPSCGLSQSFSEGMQILQAYNEPAQSPSTSSALENRSAGSLDILVCTLSQSSGAVISQPLLSRNSLQPIEAPITKLQPDWDNDTGSEVVTSPQPEIPLNMSKSTSLPLSCCDVLVQMYSQSQLVIDHPFSPANNAGITGCQTTGELKSFVFQFKVGIMAT